MLRGTGDDQAIQTAILSRLSSPSHCFFASPGQAGWSKIYLSNYFKTAILSV
jgi:hypothetical protein